MKILLTGYKGFIGSHLLSALKKEDYEVTTYEWGEPLPQVKGHDWVMHVGAISSTTETDVEKIMTQNLDSSRYFLEECTRHGVKMQFSSSASVYGKGKVFTEDAPVDPRTPYAWSKYLFERHVRQTPTPTTVQIFRYFNVYGAGEDHKGSQASPFHQFNKEYEREGYVTVFEGSDKYFRDFVSVNMVVDVHLKMLRNPVKGTWNIGTGKAKSFEEVARKITSDIRYKPMPENLKHSYQDYTCADTTRLQQVYNNLEFYR